MRSGYDTCAPIVTPCAAAAAHAAPQRRRVAAVEPARHVGAGHDAQHRRVVADLPDAVGLADVAVEVDRHGSPQSALDRGVGPLRPEQPADLLVGQPPEALERLSPRTSRATSRSSALSVRSGPASAVTAARRRRRARAVAEAFAGGLGEPRRDRRRVTAEDGVVALVEHGAVVVDVEHLVAVGGDRPRRRGSPPPSASSRG